MLRTTMLQWSSPQHPNHILSFMEQSRRFWVAYGTLCSIRERRMNLIAFSRRYFFLSNTCCTLVQSRTRPLLLREHYHCHVYQVITNTSYHLRNVLQITTSYAYQLTTSTNSESLFAFDEDSRDPIFIFTPSRHSINIHLPCKFQIYVGPLQWTSFIP